MGHLFLPRRCAHWARRCGPCKHSRQERSRLIRLSCSAASRKGPLRSGHSSRRLFVRACHNELVDSPCPSNQLHLQNNIHRVGIDRPRSVLCCKLDCSRPGGGSAASCCTPGSTPSQPARRCSHIFALGKLRLPYCKCSGNKSCFPRSTTRHWSARVLRAGSQKSSHKMILCSRSGTHHPG